MVPVSRPKRRPPMAMRRAEEMYFGGWKNWDNILILEEKVREEKNERIIHSCIVV